MTREEIEALMPCVIEHVVLGQVAVERVAANYPEKECLNFNHTVIILYPYCIHTVAILYSYCYYTAAPLHGHVLF